MAQTHDHTSVRFHLSYPRRDSAFTWEECACLARSLGFRDVSIELCYRQAVDPKYQTKGFEMSQLGVFLGSKFFKSGFDFTYNSHSCEWNEQVVRRAFAVLAGRGMTFQQLHTVRVAYGLYESSDLRGLKTKPRTVMRALKACGRAISLGKMSHRVRHMRFQEPGRLQLDEFIDLALWAGPLDQEETKSALPDTKSSQPHPKTCLHELVRFEDLLTPLDGRIQRRLDAEYLREEREFIRETVQPAESRLQKCSVLEYQRARLARSQQAKAAYEPLRRAIREGSRPSTAIGTVRWSEETDEEREEEDEETRETGQALLMAPTAPRKTGSPAPLVSSTDLERTELLRDALAFQTETLPEFHARWRAENLQTLRPGFHKRHERRKAATQARAQAALEVAAAAKRAAEAAEAARSLALRRQHREQKFVELARRTESAPLPSHARVCDARIAAATTVDRPLRRRRIASARVTGSRMADSRTSPAGEGKNKADDEPWFEPRLGLELPLASGCSSLRGSVSRLGYSRSCPPRVHPIRPFASAADLADTEADTEIADLIDRVVYAKTTEATG